MRINALKPLSIAICCLVFALWSEARCADDYLERECPAGSIMSFAGKVAPRGWLLCDGHECTSRVYPRLYEVIKLEYVPNGERNRILEYNADHDDKLFFVPDLRGRVIVGVDGGVGRVTSNNTLGASGGQETHLLTANELPPHRHGVPLYGPPVPQEVNQFATIDYDVRIRNHNQYYLEKTVGSFSVGNDAPLQNNPHNNMQPYQVLNYIINTGDNERIINNLQQEVTALNIRLANHMEDSERINDLERQVRNLNIGNEVVAQYDQLSQRVGELNGIVQVLENDRNRLNGIVQTLENDRHQLLGRVNQIAQQPNLKAFVVFRGEPGQENQTMLSNYGVAAVRRGGNVGSYIIDFQNPFPNTNYCSILSAGLGDYSPHTVTVDGPYRREDEAGSGKTVNSFQLYVQGQAVGPVNGAGAYVSACFYE